MALADTLKKSLNLPDSASEDDIVKALAETVAQNKEPEKNGDVTQDKNLEASMAAAAKTLREKSEEIQLTEMQAAIKQLQDHNEQLMASLRLSEAHKAVQQLSEGKGYVLPVPAQEKLLQILVKAPKALSDDIVGLFSEVKEKGLVELNERGNNVNQDEFDMTRVDDPVKQFTMSVERRMSENSIGYTEAIHQLAQENPNLYKAYRNATFIEGSVR